MNKPLPRIGITFRLPSALVAKLVSQFPGLQVSGPGIDIGTGKVRVHRAVKELREIYLKLSGEKTSCNVKRPENTLRII